MMHALLAPFLLHSEICDARRRASAFVEMPAVALENLNATEEMMMAFKLPDDETKFKIVIEKNTFYFQNIEFEEKCEAYISLAQNLFILKNKIEQEGLKEEIFVDHIMNMEDGLDALLTLTGFSKESLLRLMTFIRVVDDKELNKIVNKAHWPKEDSEREWKLEKIKSYARSNREFVEGIVNLFFRDSTVQILRRIIPLFEFKKLI